MAETLAYVWAVLLGLILVLYVVLDGFDLGIGVLSLLTLHPGRRSAMINSIAAVWDANETWLVLAGGVLFGAFPTVYSVALNALYVPVMLMLFGLIFRAVSFEFRAHSDRPRAWEIAFGLGSLAAVLGQGFTVGGLLSGIAVRDSRFVGGPWDWLNGLSVLAAVAVGFGYTMLGASYLIRKVSDEMRPAVQAQVVVSGVLMFLAAGAATALAPFVLPDILETWLSGSGRFYMPALLAGVVFALVMLLLATRYRTHSKLPLAASLAIFALIFVGGVAATHPYLVPPSITVVQGASTPATLKFMLVGIGPLIPVMLLYNLYLYRVFRGQVHEGDAYGD